MAESKDGSPQQPLSDILQNLPFENPSEIALKITGQKLAKRIYSDQWGANTNLSFFSIRAARWLDIEKWSLGKQDMTQFYPFMNMVPDAANKVWANIDMTPTNLGPLFVGVKVESIAKTDEYPCVKAIDSNSEDEKADRMFEALWRMKEVENIKEMQQAAGVQLEPTDAYVPDDELSAKVYFELEDRLPKEIKFEKILANSLISADYQRVLKPKLLRDNVVFNFESTKIEKLGQREYTFRNCIPKNCFYNFFLSDTGKQELSYFGEVYNLKVKDARRKYGKTEDRPNGLSEQELYDFAKKSSQNFPANPIGFNHQFSQQYSSFNGNTPWDDYSCFVIDFSIEVSESDYFVTKVDSYGKQNIAPKNGIPKPTSERAVIQKKDKTRWWNGVYAPYADIMVSWGKDLTILDYTNTERALCPYSVNIPNNNGEYAPSLFERAMEPIKRHALIVLKIKLLIGKLSPAQYRVDIEGARDVLDGTGNVYTWEQIVQIKDATGVELYSSKGLDPLTPGNPTFSAATADPTINNIIQLSELLKSTEAEIRVLLGTPIYLDGADVGQRTAAKLAEGQAEGAFNVTGFIPNGHNQLMEDTLNKICILHWQDVVTDKQESSQDLINTVFRTSVKMKSTEYEKQLLEQDIQRYSQMPDAQDNPSVSLKDAMMIRNIPDYKMQCWYLASVFEENRRKAIKDSERLQAQNAKVQEDSLQAKADNDAALEDKKMQAEKDLEMFRSTQAKELALVQGYMAAIAKGTISADMIMPVIQQLMPNLIIPLKIENNHLAQISQQQDIAQQQGVQQAQQDQQEQNDPNNQQQGMAQPQAQQMQPQQPQSPVMQ